jgi:hypothetical protein
MNRNLSTQEQRMITVPPGQGRGRIGGIIEEVEDG